MWEMGSLRANNSLEGHQKPVMLGEFGTTRKRPDRFYHLVTGVNHKDREP